jgi:hypothetical protein
VTLDCPSFSVTDEDLYDTRTYDLDCGGVGIFQLPTTRTPTCDAFIQQLEERDLDALGEADFEMKFNFGPFKTNTLSGLSNAYNNF